MSCYEDDTHARARCLRKMMFFGGSCNGSHGGGGGANDPSLCVMFCLFSFVLLKRE